MNSSKHSPSVPESQRLTFNGATRAEKLALQKEETLSRTRGWKDGRNRYLTHTKTSTQRVSEVRGQPARPADREREKIERERRKCPI